MANRRRKWNKERKRMCRRINGGREKESKNANGGRQSAKGREVDRGEEERLEKEIRKMLAAFFFKIHEECFGI